MSDRLARKSGIRLYPFVSELTAIGAPIRVPIAVACKVLILHRQHYYAWLAQSVTTAELDEAYRADANCDAHLDGPEFGYRFLPDEVRAAGHEVSERTVWKICSPNGWWSVFGKRKRGRMTKVGAPAHDDLVLREFRVDGPNKVWLTDIEHHEAFLNRAVVMDTARGSRSEPAEAEGSLIPGMRERVEAALTTTGRTSTARWSGSG